MRKWGVAVAVLGVLMLAGAALLRYVVVQQLVASTDGGLVPAVGVLAVRRARASSSTSSRSVMSVTLTLSPGLRLAGGSTLPRTAKQRQKPRGSSMAKKPSKSSRNSRSAVTRTGYWNLIFIAGYLGKNVGARRPRPYEIKT